MAIRPESILSSALAGWTHGQSAAHLAVVKALRALIPVHLRRNKADLLRAARAADLEWLRFDVGDQKFLHAVAVLLSMEDPQPAFNAALEEVLTIRDGVGWPVIPETLEGIATAAEGWSKLVPDKQRIYVSDQFYDYAGFRRSRGQAETVDLETLRIIHALLRAIHDPSVSLQDFADSYGMAAAKLSQKIGQAERWLGLELLVRNEKGTKRSNRPTPFGLEFEGALDGVFSSWDRQMKHMKITRPTRDIRPRPIANRRRPVLP